MGGNPSIHYLAVPVAILVGVLLCFWGYRLVKVALGIIGFIIGAAGGWELGLALAPDSSGAALVGGIMGGIVGALLCVWLFAVGIFLLGASVGAVIGQALFGASSPQTQTIMILVCAIALGIIALVVQRYAIIACTGLGGAYLVVGGIAALLTGNPNSWPVLFDASLTGPGGVPWFVLPALWLVLALAGIAVQLRGAHERTVPVSQEV